MSSIGPEEKITLILANETATARQLALHVVEKPVPRVWMIFIPILFVLYFSKLKQFESALKDFAEHYIVPRRMILTAILVSEKKDQPVNIELLIDQLGNLNAETRALCKEWLTVLVEHFKLLFSIQGSTYAELVLSGYKSKENYLHFCDYLCTTELAVNQALLVAIDGNVSDLNQVARAMDEGLRTLRIKEARTIFP